MALALVFTPFSAGLVGGSITGMFAPDTRWNKYGMAIWFVCWIILYTTVLAWHSEHPMNVIPLALGISGLWGSIPFAVTFFLGRFVTEKLRAYLVTSDLNIYRGGGAMGQNEGEVKADGREEKTLTLRCWMGFVLAFVVYWLVANNPLGFFAAYLRYNLAIFLPLIVLAKFVRNEANSRFGTIFQFLRKVNTFVFERVFEKIKLVLLGFALGFMLWSFVFYIIPRMKIAHLQRVHQMQQLQQIHKNSILGGK